MVRPKLEHCPSIWDPPQQKNIKKLEMVQHRAARFVSNTPHVKSDVSISNIIRGLGWESLERRRLNSRLVLLHKVHNKLVEVPSSYMPTLREPQPQRGHQRQFTRYQPSVDVFKSSFLPRTIADWNLLDENTVAAPSLDDIQNQ